MQTKSYIKLNSVVEIIQRNLLQYLRQTGYTRAYTEEELVVIDRAYTEKAPRFPHPIETGKFMYIGVGGFGNIELTLKRMSNVFTASNQLSELLNTASIELNESELETALSRVRDVVQTGLQQNNQLSVCYTKDHRTFTQNNSLGMGFFASWWNKTWFQSRATIAFEKSVNQINQYLPANVTATAPSASYTKLKSTVESMQRNLCQYLRQTGYTRAYTEEELVVIDRLHTENAPRIPHPFETGKYIYIGLDAFRINELTLKRMSNVLTASNQLSELLNTASTELNESELETALSSVRDVVQTGLQQNNQLSVCYAKDHRTFTQNNSLGMGFFASWWNKTWFQSRATIAFEKSLDELENKAANSHFSSRQFDC